jgi:hypothetical protein
MRREVLASWTAWVRRLAPSLSKRRLEWVFTVFSLTKRRAAISRLLRPADEAEDFEFARGDGELGEARFVEDEGFGGLGGDFVDDDGRFFSSEGEAEPDAESGEERGD